MTEACEQTSTGLAIGALLASSSARGGAEGASTAVVEAGVTVATPPAARGRGGCLPGQGGTADEQGAGDTGSW